MPPATAEARAGYAEGAFTLERGGRVQCRAESGEADQSQVVSLAVQVAAGATPPATESPTASPTQPSATPRPTPTAAPEETVSPPATTGPRPPAAGSLRPVDGADLGLAGICVLVAAAAGVPLLGRRRRRSLVRWVLLAVIGGMAGYVLYALQVVRPEVWGLLPQGAWSERAAVAIVAAVASLLPLPLVIGRGETGK